MIFDTIVQLLRLMGDEDHRQKQAHRPPSDTNDWFEDPPLWRCGSWVELRRIYSDQVALASDLVQRLAQRQAQIFYFYGMMAGAILLLAVVAGLNLWASWPPLGSQDNLAPLRWLCALVAGVGAIVSVMQRMSSDSCLLRYRVGWPVLVLLGIFRPLIGAVFASIIVLLVASRIVPVQMSSFTQGEPTELAFFVVVAFFAGFSERWAQDMLGVGAAQLAARATTAREASA